MVTYHNIICFLNIYHILCIRVILEGLRFIVICQIKPKPNSYANYNFIDRIWGTWNDFHQFLQNPCPFEILWGALALRYASTQTDAEKVRAITAKLKCPQWPPQKGKIVFHLQLADAWQMLRRVDGWSQTTWSWPAIFKPEWVDPPWKSSASQWASTTKGIHPQLHSFVFSPRAGAKFPNLSPFFPACF